MKGSFAVSGLYDLPEGGWGLKGTVVTGTLEAGMEARRDAIVVIIRDLKALEDFGKALKRGRKGMKVVIIPFLTVREVLEACVGQILDFEDVRSIPVRSVLALGVE